MEPLFGSVVVDVIIVVVCGLIGGFGLGLLHENGIELPRRRQKHEDDDTRTVYFDFGFLADMFIGALAAVIVYALNPPANGTQLIGTSLVAGLGGAGILKGYVEARRNQSLTHVAARALDLAEGEEVGAVRSFGAEGGASMTSRGEEIETLRRQLRELAN